MCVIHLSLNVVYFPKGACCHFDKTNLEFAFRYWNSKEIYRISCAHAYFTFLQNLLSHWHYILTQELRRDRFVAKSTDRSGTTGYKLSSTKFVFTASYSSNSCVEVFLEYYVSRWKFWVTLFCRKRSQVKCPFLRGTCDSAGVAQWRRVPFDGTVSRKISIIPPNICWVLLVWWRE